MTAPRELARNVWSSAVTSVEARAREAPTHPASPTIPSKSDQSEPTQLSPRAWAATGCRLSPRLRVHGLCAFRGAIRLARVVTQPEDAARLGHHLGHVVESPRLESVSDSLHLPLLDDVALQLRVRLVVEYERRRVATLPSHRRLLVLPLVRLLLEERLELGELVEPSRGTRDELRATEGLVALEEETRVAGDDERRGRQQDDPGDDTSTGPGHHLGRRSRAGCYDRADRGAVPSSFGGRNRERRRIFASMVRLPSPRFQTRVARWTRRRAGRRTSPRRRPASGLTARSARVFETSACPSSSRRTSWSRRRCALAPPTDFSPPTPPSIANNDDSIPSPLPCPLPQIEFASVHLPRMCEAFDRASAADLPADHRDQSWSWVDDAVPAVVSVSRHPVVPRRRPNPHPRPRSPTRPIPNPGF